MINETYVFKKPYICRRCGPTDNYSFVKALPRPRRECRKCSNDYSREYNKKHPEKLKARAKRYQVTEKCKIAVRKTNLKRKFGITPEQYEKMLKDQNGVCFICNGVNKNNKRLAVDHCHKTNKIRKLLCMRCNTGIGFFREDPRFLTLASLYVFEDVGDIHAAYKKALDKVELEYGEDK